MLLTSSSFLLFLGVLLILYYLVPGRFQWMLLLAADYVFYFMAGPVYPVYLTATACIIWAGARIIHRMERKDRKRRLLFILCLFLSLGILAVCKYAAFAADNANAFIQFFGGRPIRRPSLILPMGISFYTFQAVGYLIDVYRGTQKPEENLPKFLLFVSFFPQLVQGPISRFADLGKTLYGPHAFDRQTLICGAQRILWGFFKKLVVADRILAAVRTLIDQTEVYRCIWGVVLMLFYALELYADFTGGIDIAIGSAQMLGIDVTENFNRPFFSKSIAEYWKRWHITMGTWFMDYVFYPVSVSRPMRKLGKSARRIFGNGVGKRIPVYLSSLIVWLLTGLWHGAGWNFVLWGLANFVVIMISSELEGFYRAFRRRFPYQERIWYRGLQVIRTFLIMSMIRLFDCFPRVSDTFSLIGSVFSGERSTALTPANLLSLGITGPDYLILGLSVLLMIAVSLVQRRGSVRGQIGMLPRPVQYLIWYGLFVVILMFGCYGIGYDASQFIYNRF